MANRKGQSIEERLIASARQAVAIKKGEMKPARAYSLPRTAREVVVSEPQNFASADVVRIRNKLGLSQTVFAKVLGKSAPTVRSWEQGQKTPDPAANRMLEIADKHPRVLLELVRKAD